MQAVAFESSNSVTNRGAAAWSRTPGSSRSGFSVNSIPTPRTTIALPIVAGSEATLGPIVNDAYFGKVPPDRLTVKGSVVLFRADGQYRSKIGLPPARARSIAGSYDAAAHVLTLVQYSRPENATRYVNSMWEIQKEPFHGDVVNSYNDGPPAPGQPPLGPFYELETSSPALALAPGARHTHVHRTFHFVGSEAELDRLARATLNIRPRRSVQRVPAARAVAQHCTIMPPHADRAAGTLRSPGERLRRHRLQRIRLSRRSVR